MRVDMCRGDEIVELYFYDELTPREREEASAHFAVCEACRASLADLRAIGDALASRADDAQPEGGWRPFMARLEARLDATRTFHPSSLSTMRLGQLAAALALVASGAAGGWLLSRDGRDTPREAAPRAGYAVAEAGQTELERARVVLAGLAQKSDGEAWSLERQMAASLLPDVRLIRQAAADRGRGDLADILTDVEALLLQASYAETDDSETLARLRGMIDRRDLLMRLSLARRGI